LQGDEIVTVIDPRDPLYGQSFTLLFVENKSYRGECCVVRMETGIERHIPISVTDQAPEQFRIYPLPLNLSSVRELLAVYARLIRQLTERAEDGSPAQNSPSVLSQILSPTPSARTLGAPDTGTAAESEPGAGHHLPTNPSASDQ
jgi:hypothetical protein